MSHTLVAVSVGLPRQYRDKIEDNDFYQSGIVKTPVEGPVHLTALNLVGDYQADQKNHAGPFRAVLGYGADHYPSWRDQLGIDLPYGAFGENFTITDLTEHTVCLGDIYSIGSEVIVQVTQPRMPCFKLANRWNRKDLIELVLNQNKGGWYHRVLQQGAVEAGMPVTRLERIHPDFPVARVVELRNKKDINPDAFEALAGMEVLTPKWREMFAQRLGASA